MSEAVFESAFRLIEGVRSNRKKRSPDDVSITSRMRLRPVRVQYGSRASLIFSPSLLPIAANDNAGSRRSQET